MVFEIRRKSRIEEKDFVFEQIKFENFLNISKINRYFPIAYEWTLIENYFKCENKQKDTIKFENSLIIRFFNYICLIFLFRLLKKKLEW